MTELIAIIGTGIALAGLIGTGQRGLRAELGGLRTEQHGIRAEMRDRFNAMDTRLTAIEHQQGELRERMAHLEGLLDGLREAITGRRGAA